MKVIHCSTFLFSLNQVALLKAPMAWTWEHHTSDKYIWSLAGPQHGLWDINTVLKRTQETKRK